MNRLTHKREDGTYYAEGKMQEIIDRLAAYEDLELSPAEILEMEADRIDMNKSIENMADLIKQMVDELEVQW